MLKSSPEVLSINICALKAFLRPSNFFHTTSVGLNHEDFFRGRAPVRLKHCLIQVFCCCCCCFYKI